ncbi:glutaminase A [Aquihabitans daechungensis]|uniref:glutaminase A n=1 Tax=Aquihabitans daechungensis TaxID=1052257 RepID=UPI003BA0EE8F
MHEPLPFDESQTKVSTGDLPALLEVEQFLHEAFVHYRDDDDGAVADYIPALAQADPTLFGACITGAAGLFSEVGDARHEFSIQSVSKPFVFALVCDALGHLEVLEKVGVNGTGLPFNSVMAIELNDARTMNPMVNAGAMATTSLVPGATKEEKWEFVRAGLSRFAGRELVVDEDVYASETATNLRNQGIAHLLDGYGRMYFDPDDATDVYTRQCSLLVSAHDLSVMGATLADGGVNPITGERAIEAHTCKRVLAVLATAGLYERSGDWLYEIGIPGKSGVSGGIVAIAPGKGAIGVFSPRLDAAGNSVRGQKLVKNLSQRLGLNLFASAPVGFTGTPPPATPST